MPRSQLSIASTTASSQYSRKYRTKSKESVADETLFSKPVPLRVEDDFVKDKKKPLMSRVDIVRMRPRKPDAVRLITKDLIRDLVIPKEDPSGLTVILDRPKFSRILQSCEVKSQIDLLQDREYVQMEKEKAAFAAKKRKEEMQQRDLQRMQSQKLSDLDFEAKKQSQYLLETAFAKRLEQEDEIKHLNELCLNARCHAIRDAQLIEKKIIKDEVVTEEKRLDNLMEADRVSAVRLQEKIADLRKQARYEGASMVMKQIEKKAQDKLLDLEKRDQECQQMLKYLEKLQREDIEAMDIKRVKQKKLKEDQDKVNEACMKQQLMRLEQDRMAEKKVIDFQRKKADREAELENEQNRIRREKEIEIARLRDLQERACDVKAQQDALRAKRHSEEAEREWRRKEEDAMMKQANVNQVMQKARTEQINAKQCFMAVEAQRERSEFSRVLKELQHQIEKDRLQEEAVRSLRLKYADFVRNQIIDKETVKLAERKAFFHEGIKMEEEARQRKARLEEVKKKKLEQLRLAGVPDKYCLDVERRITNPHERLGAI